MMLLYPILTSYFDEEAYQISNPEANAAVINSDVKSVEEYFWKSNDLSGPYLSPDEIYLKTAPLISVVIPAYNSAAFVASAIKSVLNQTEKNLELIIVDDGSCDATPKVLWEESQKDSRIILLRKENGGTGSALNFGFKYAKGKYSTWLSSDSWWELNCLKDLLDCLENNPEIVMAYGDWTLFDNHNKTYTYFETPEWDKNFLRKEYKLGTNWLWRTSAKNEVGEFKSDLCEDYDFMLRLSDVGPFKRVPQSLGIWRNHENNLSSTVCNIDGWLQSSIHRSRYWWGKARLKVAVICPSIDPAGALWKTVKAINCVSDKVACRHVINHSGVVFTGGELWIGKDSKEIAKVLEEADIIHFNCVWGGARPLWPDTHKSIIDITKYLGKKPLIMHFHGEGCEWYQDKMAFWQNEYNATLISCNPSISKRVNGARYISNIIPLDTEGYGIDGAYLYNVDPNWLTKTGPVRFMMHHNYLAGKGVLQVGEMFRYLGAGPDFNATSSVYGEPRMKMREHSRHKAMNYDVCIDQITQGFVGLATWESMAMGLVTIARLDQFAIDEYTKMGDGVLPPIINVHGIDWLAEQVIKLSRDRDLVVDYKKRSRDWMLTHYNTKKMVGVYEDLYEGVLNK